MRLAFNNRGTERWVSTIIISSTILAACNNMNEKQDRTNLDDLKKYARDKKDSVDVYADRSWDELNASFEEKKAKLDKDTAKMNEELRAEYYQVVDQWENYRAEHEQKAAEKRKTTQMDDLRKSLVLDGVRVDYTDLTADKIETQYQHFVNTVEQNKDVYTKEQWQIINVNWQALNGRKRELEKDLSASVKGEIVKQQVKYTAIKALNRPEAPNM